ncbi:UDP-N-acetylmuramate--L-alanine ligase [Pseudothermotoga sp. U03pept]|uniref:UDP-N-acetylmuramate--L-alanine ligase n=1 Tax=Pseudothermotoga sp. U03pept TaxID=3447012 RepID=UPI0030B6A298
MKIHFVGIGGIGMSSLALHCRLRGDDVYGSDICGNEQIDILRSAGIHVFIGHSYENWLHPDVVVHTPAVHSDNPEILRARAEGVKVMSRSEFLRSILDGVTQFAITGSDGKTTTTAMVAHCLKSLGEDPTVFLGGMHKSLEFYNYRSGKGPYVYELDESQPEFSAFSPDFLIITNARQDHLENYDNNENFYRSCFENLARKTRRAVITFSEDKNTSNLGTHTFGRSSGTCKLLSRERKGLLQIASIELAGRQYELKLKVPGEHNVLNAMAVLTLLWSIGYNVDAVLTALEDFVSTHRRFDVTVLNERDRTYVVDDYAHTPDEIRSLIAAAKEVFPEEKKVVIFQPHRYTRLLREDGNFAKALKDADEIYVTEVYGAFEKAIPQISAKMIVDGLISHGKQARYFPKLEELLEAFKPQEKTVYLFVGAGDIIKVSQRFVQNYSQKRR